MSKFTEPIPIDLASALERTGGEMDFLEELIDLFMGDFKEKYAALKDAVKQKDALQIQEIAHNLKGSSANLGLTPLQETFFQLETAGRNDDLSGTGKKIDLLQIQFDELINYWENRDQIEQNQSKSEPKAKDFNLSPESKILLADDSKDNQLLMQSYLSQTGIGIDIANDGNEAIKLFLERSYSIIFLDLHMPGLDGIETVQKIKKIETENDLTPTPIVCFSGSSFQDEIDLCMSSGFDDYLEKPCDRDTLFNIINKFTENGFIEEGSGKIRIDESILDIVPTYLENRRSDIKKIKAALEADDISTIESLAHKMKGSGTSYGFEKISLIGKLMESSAMENDRDEIHLLVKKLELFLEKVQYD
ncbi:MAG: Hpt domain-containing protein [Candidatus Aminicenantes bacterium]|nr:Hpt domain-containing protein [Candidatus Aminicenantes bacterium]